MAVDAEDLGNRLLSDIDRVLDDTSSFHDEDLVRQAMTLVADYISDCRSHMDGDQILNVVEKSCRQLANSPAKKGDV